MKIEQTLTLTGEISGSVSLIYVRGIIHEAGVEVRRDWFTEAEIEAWPGQIIDPKGILLK